MNLLTHLQSLGYELENIILDGQSWNRCKINGSEGLNGWVNGYTLSNGSVCAFYNDWSSGEEPKYWEDLGAGGTGDELLEAATRKQEMLLKQKELAEKRKLTQKEAQEKAWYIWDRCKEITQHNYLTKKAVKPHGARLSSHGQLVIPIYNEQEEICSLQFIGEDGAKKYLTGGQKGFSLIGKHDYNTLCVCEGWATGASIHEATGLPVLVALDAKNMEKLTSTLNKFKLYKEIIICADNDTTGLDSAVKSRANLQAITGVKTRLVYPQFSQDVGLTDWNDYMQIYGPEKTGKDILLENLPEFPPPVRGAKQKITDLDLSLASPIPWHTPAGGKKPAPPSQLKVARALYDLYGQDLMREERNIFLWTGTHWLELSNVYFKSQIRNAGQRLMGGQAKDSDLDAYYKMFLDLLDRVPEGMSFYKQLPNICNFLDGTLKVNKLAKKIEFMPHSKHDFITWVLPYEYSAPRPENPVFSKWLQDTFEGDQDKLRVIAQIGGACLVPISPILSFFHGPAGTGKSTFAKLCSAFIGPDNYSTVPPEDMHGFLMESMINKRVNIVTDISGGRIDKGIFKRFHDATELLINRKGMKAVKARLPYLHIFCDNELPKGIDANSNAMDRRAVIVEMTKVLPEGEMQQDYEQVILNAGPGAILDFFLKGLEDLVQCGMIFHKSENSKKLVENWKLENDPVGQFLWCVENKEIDNILVNKSGRIRQKDLFESFEVFTKDRHPITRIRFYDLVRNKGYQTITVKGFDYFSGLEIKGKQVEI